jgi:hypothetical protein
LAMRSAVASVTLFPEASERNTEVTVQTPSSLPFGKMTGTVPDADVFAVNVADAVCVTPEGPVKIACIVVAPDKSSVT